MSHLLTPRRLHYSETLHFYSALPVQQKSRCRRFVMCKTLRQKIVLLFQNQLVVVDDNLYHIIIGLRTLYHGVSVFDPLFNGKLFHSSYPTRITFNLKSEITAYPLLQSKCVVLCNIHIIMHSKFIHVSTKNIYKRKIVFVFGL